MNDRLTVSLYFGAFGGLFAWCIHGAAKAVGWPRLGAYMLVAGAITFLVDYLTEPTEIPAVSWTGAMNEPR